jgi:hypothetical protein
MLDAEREEYFEAMEQKGAIRIPASDFRSDFITELNKDIELLKEIHNWWFGD